MTGLVRYLLKSFVILVSVGAYLTVTSYGAWAQAITSQQAISAGQTVGAAGFGQMPVGVDQQGNLTIPTGNGKTTTMTPAQLSQTSSANYQSNVGTIGSVYGSNAAMNQAGVNEQTTLSTGNAMPNQAYQTLLNVKQNGTGTFTSNDPMFTSATAALSNQSLMSSFAACSPTTTSTNSSTKLHVPSYVTCNVANPVINNYTMVHDYNYPTVPVTVSGDATLVSCGNGCAQIVAFPDPNVATEDQFNVGGRATVSYNVNYPIISVTVVSANLGNNNSVTIGSGAVTNYGKYCWDKSQNYFNDLDQNACSAGLANFPLDVTQQSSGSLLLVIPGSNFNSVNTITLQINYQAPATTPTDGWSPSQYVAAVTTPDAQCKVTAGPTCTNMPTTDANGCATINGNYVCPSEMDPSPFPGISPLCQQVTATVDCSQFDVGQGETYQTGQGQQVTLTSNGSTPNGCAAEQANPACVFNSQSCVQGAEGATTGTCYVEAQVWDCGQDTNVNTTNTTTNQNCAGPVQCMGTSCSSTSQSINSNFGTAYAALQAVQGMQQDSSCVTGSGGGSSCSIFPGTALTCKKAVGGIVDCCKTPAPVNFVTYLQAGMEAHTAYTTAQGMGLLGNNAPNLNLTGPGSVTSQIGDALGLGGDAEDPSFLDQASSLISDAEDEIQNAATEWLADTFGDEAATEIVTDMIVDVIPGLNAIMLAYTIYQIAMMVIQLIWQCESSEQQLATEIADKQCHYLGTYCAQSALGVCVETKDSYCCFSSPLSRIMQEQIRMQPQVGVSWGTAQAPNCQALTMAELGTVNWSQVNLSEWIGMLNIADIGTASMQLSADGLTGSGSYISQATGTPQQNAIQRAINSSATLTSPTHP